MRRMVLPLIISGTLLMIYCATPAKVSGETLPLDVSSKQDALEISSTCCPDGDVAPLGSNDGIVNVADALIALRFALNLEPGHPTSDELCHGDVAPLDNTDQPDPDGQMTVGDALVILRKALDLVSWGDCSGPSVPAGYVYVEPGTDAGDNVTINDPFSISQYEITNQQMVEVMQWAYDQSPRLINASSTTVSNSQGQSRELLDLDDDDCQISFREGTFRIDSGMGHYPCVEVTWYGAAAYCNYLSEQEGRTSAYDLSNWILISGTGGYRLPSENQWEYAARGGKDGNDTLYSGSDTIDAVAWYWGNSDASGNSNFYNNHGMLPVGQKDPNELGTYDMSGNLWEWCQDWYSGSEGSSRVLRGGHWGVEAFRCRVFSPYEGGPELSGNGVGFRPVLPANP